VRKLGEGIKPENIDIPLDLPTLRDTSVAWTLDAWLYFRERPELICQAWKNCKVGHLNFSWESLTSAAATDNIEDLVTNDEIFRQLIGSKDPPLPYSSDPVFHDAEAHSHFDDNEDDSLALVD
jgi:hypothetical protein